MPRKDKRAKAPKPVRFHTHAVLEDTVVALETRIAALEATLRELPGQIAAVVDRVTVVSDAPPTIRRTPRPPGPPDPA